MKINLQKMLRKMLRIVLLMMVLVWLGWSVQKTVTQWELAAQKNNQLRLELESQLRRGNLDSAQRRRLNGDFARVVAAAPKFANVHWDRIALALCLYVAALVPNGIVLGSIASALTLAAATDRSLFDAADPPASSDLAAAIVPPAVAVSSGTAVAAQVLGHVGKYVPGKALVVVLRVGALRGVGIPTSAATIAVFIETLLMMSVGSGLSAIVLWWAAVPRWMSISGLALGVVAAIPTIPAVLVRIVSAVSQQPVAPLKSAIHFRLTARCWLLSAIGWLLIGGSVTTIVTAMPGVDGARWLTFYIPVTAAISLAVVIGFISLLPGGAGARELVLMTVLSTVVDVPTALLTTIATRLVFIVGESIAAAAGWWFLSRPQIRSRRIVPS